MTPEITCPLFLIRGAVKLFALKNYSTSSHGTEARVDPHLHIAFSSNLTLNTVHTRPPLPEPGLPPQLIHHPSATLLLSYMPSPASLLGQGIVFHDE
jgi:hypothetical protein